MTALGKAARVFARHVVRANVLPPLGADALADLDAAVSAFDEADDAVARIHAALPSSAPRPRTFPPEGQRPVVHRDGVAINDDGRYVVIMDQDELDALAAVAAFHHDDPEEAPYDRVALRRLRDRIEPHRTTEDRT